MPDMSICAPFLIIRDMILRSFQALVAQDRSFITMYGAPTTVFMHKRVGSKRTPSLGVIFLKRVGALKQSQNSVIICSRFYFNPKMTGT